MSEILKQTGIKVKLTDTNSNFIALLNKVTEALKRGKQSKEFIDAFIKEATSSDYAHLLCTITEVVDVE